MPDLKTRYMGLELDCPIIAGSSAITKTSDGVARCADAGAGAVVLKSLFEEQIRLEYAETTAAMEAWAHPEAIEYLQSDVAAQFGPRDYLELIEKSVKRVQVPVIASVNCLTSDSWVKFARQIEQAGAAALELNIYILPLDPEESGDALERRYLETAKAVVQEVKIPVAVKLTPYLTNLTRMSHRLEKAGVKGLVLFNRLFQPDLDPAQRKVVADLSLSNPREHLLSMRWISLLFGHVHCDICASTGVHDGDSAAKMLLAGASAVQVVSAMYKNKIEEIGVIRDRLAAWMDEQGLSSLDEIRGSLSRFHAEGTDLHERVQYIKAFVGHE